MNTFEYAAIVLGMFAVTFSIRFVLFARAHRFSMPTSLERMLRYVPVAVLSAIIAPMIFMPGGQFTLSLVNPWFLGSLAAFAVGIWRKQLLLTIVVGVVVFFAIKLFV